MVNRQRVLLRARQDPTIMAKLKRLESTLEAFCPDLNEDFWAPGGEIQGKSESNSSKKEGAVKPSRPVPSRQQVPRR